ncbi:nucleotidyl transferase AbiEii/AbiGii toxin family protein [Candidatus Vampirococcus lugosii]|uniref:Nucleotidyl transferase AbiEii toxin, Type IV TA system n=1 Tax=Candidatus Vampirococcus lugosii TaxID=2789015 RepID=A0ABS5QM29_9BACT|nr:nucleotidyl transferase AbiEii/AbiGii toxin family protein [Candidatus Vampirococcus lugosii]MBS8121534.1 Nucleotidyl transferase AbiEii toxin, Type IV TA system [Candidatus Vampirococcus lugosii]
MLNTDKHRQIMFLILKDIFSSKLGKYLAFKGGTACYFLYGLDRFSTDLDFDLLEDFEQVDEEMVDILKKYGKVKKGHNILLSYGEYDVNIKIDINRKIWKNNKYEIVNFYGTDIKVQDKSTIFANKLVSFIERNANRDIYDIYFFFKNLFDVNEKVIEERTGKTYKKALIQIREKLEKSPKNYKILDGLGEVLTQDQKNFCKK